MRLMNYLLWDSVLLHCPVLGSLWWTIDTVDVLDSLGQRDGNCVDEESFQRYHLAILPTSRESVADDDVDDLCYTVDVCNRFSLLTVETLEDFPTELGCVPIMKATKSKGGPKKSVSFEDWGSPTRWQRYTSSGEKASWN